MTDRQEDAVFALKRQVTLLSATPPDMVRERVRGFLSGRVILLQSLCVTIPTVRRS